MTRREAVRRVLAHEEVRPVPHVIKFTVEAREAYASHLGRAFDLVADTGAYVVASHTNDGWPQIRPGYFRDHFGVVWNRTVDRTLGVVTEPLLREPSLSGFAFPDPDALPVYGQAEKNLARFPDHYHMVSIGFTLFERAWSLCGMSELLVWMLTEAPFVEDLLDRITEYNIAIIRNAAAISGVDCIHYGDDWGSQQGPLIHPDLWRQLVKPRFQRTCRAARESGLHNSLHCCGNVEALMPDIIECGVDVFDPFQPEAMDIWGLRRLYRGRLAFWGGLSVQRTMPRGTPGDVRREGERLLRDMAAGGGYIFAPAHALTGDVPADNIDALLELVMNQPGFAG